MPNIEDDAVPMANLIKSRQPNILTVALDPEGTGPDTHYKVLLVCPPPRPSAPLLLRPLLSLIAI
jgi:hypothetical protein